MVTLPGPAAWPDAAASSRQHSARRALATAPGAGATVRGAGCVVAVALRRMGSAAQHAAVQGGADRRGPVQAGGLASDDAVDAGQQRRIQLAARIGRRLS